MFVAQWPVYLEMGMSYNEFWHGEAELTKYFREADNIRLSKANRQAWIQGLYFANAVAACLDKKADYPKEPLYIYQHEQEAKKSRDRQRAIEFFNNFALMHGKKEGG